jgi:hypothetical protein
VDVRVAAVDYPDGTSRPADAQARVTATLVAGNGSERAYGGAFLGSGRFSVQIPAADLSAIGPGSHTLVVQTVLGTGAPDTEVTQLVVF